MLKYEVDKITQTFENESLNKANFEEMLNNLNIKIIKKESTVLEFDLINCHSSIANSLRRIILTEIPTVAFHEISLYENDTIFPGEFLAQRIGLIPIHCENEDRIDSNNSGVSIGDIEFLFDVYNETDSNKSIYSDSIVPLNAELFEKLNVTLKINKKVLICKLAPGNKLKMTLKLKFGVGKEHAKWSPVSLCTFRLLPKITFKRDFIGKEGEDLQKCFSPGVIEMDKETNLAKVVNTRLESMSREFLRDDRFKNDVVLSRFDGWYCFTIETINMCPIKLLKKGILKLKEKFINFKDEINSI